MAKISIIIPVYNAQTYLKNCLESVINQTLKDIEIICVNDGSTDKSLDILEEYAQNDSRIIILTQSNLGQGLARNKGIDIANGEFIGFVDADDVVDLDMFEGMYNAAKKFDVDCVNCNYNINYISLGYVKESMLAQSLNIRLRKNIIYYDTPLFTSAINANIITLFSGPVWNKIYKTQILKEFNIRFPNCRMQEDTCFNVHSHLFLKRFVFIENKYYTYNVHQKSTSTGVSNIHFEIFGAIKNLKEILMKHSLYNKYENYYQDYVLLVFLIHLPHIPEDMKNTFTEKFKPFIGEEKYTQIVSKYLK